MARVLAPNRPLTLGLAPLVGFVLVLSACASRPDVDVLADAILTAAADDPSVSVTDAQADCIARELLSSGLSDTTLSGMAEDFDYPVVLSDEVDDVEPMVNIAATECIGGG